MPERHMGERPLEPGKLYLRLFHGRPSTAEEMHDWGQEGPTIGPLEYVHTTYMCDIKFAASPAVMNRFFPEVIAEWRDKGYSNAMGPQCDWHLTLQEDLIAYGGTFYGDWSLFIAGDKSPSWPA